MKTLDELADNTHLIIDGSKTSSIHPDVVEIIEDFKEKASNRGVKIEMINLRMDYEFERDWNKLMKLLWIGLASSQISQQFFQ